MTLPKILVLDIETSPIISYTWGLFDQNIGLNQIKQDWHILACCAKWLDNKEVFYYDQRNEKDITKDKPLLLKVWKLLDEADIVLTQNGKKFDVKKLNARFLLNNIKPPSSFRQIDTLVIAKKYFGLTSNKLEFMSNKLCTKYKKRKVKKFPGFDLWAECLKGNKKAWEEMRLYNIQDVLSLEELYRKLIPWDNSINFAVYAPDKGPVCPCGKNKFRAKGYAYTASGRFQRYECMNCGAQQQSKQNLLSKEEKKSLRR